MDAETAVLTFSIGPVHTFIAQARRVADLWAGSVLLSRLIQRAIGELHRRGGVMLFPYVAREVPIPEGLPNRLVCSVPLAQAEAIAIAMHEAVVREWYDLVARTVDVLATVGIVPDRRIWSGSDVSAQSNRVLDVAWSWVPETDGYRAASLRGARQFAASRLYRPFPQVDEPGVKCPLCGERTALPNGNADDVRRCWENAAARSKGGPLERYFRMDQSRLCLVCATKRLFAHLIGRVRQFEAFERFQPADDKPYFAVVTMDGDEMGKRLAGDPELDDAALKTFHHDVSTKLTRFANDLRTRDSSELNLSNVHCTSVGDQPPQLIYAGGEDVLFVADPRDAITTAAAIRERYRSTFDHDPRFTISGAVLFAHTKHPAGLLFHDAETLLALNAKQRAGRDALAIRLDKRSGTTTDVAFKWDDIARPPDRTWISFLTDDSRGLVGAIARNDISSVKTYQLAEDVRVLSGVLSETDDWKAWLRERLENRRAAQTRKSSTRWCRFWRPAESRRSGSLDSWLAKSGVRDELGSLSPRPRRRSVLSRWKTVIARRRPLPALDVPSQSVRTLRRNPYCTADGGRDGAHAAR